MWNFTALRGAFAALALAAAAAASWAQPLPTSRPEDVGMSSERLARMGDWLRGEVAAGRVPGAVVMVARNGRVAYYEAMGRQDPDRPDAMKRDAIFRIYSMTKPLVSVAALQMVEEGKLMLDAPVARYIPSFANVKVGVEKADAAGVKTLELVALRRPMTVQDLLRHTSGLTYGIFGDSLVKKAYRDGGVGRGDMTNAEFAEEVAKMPLMFQPGTTWEYSHSTDVLGRVLEVVEGKSLYAILKARLLDPLGMKDTSFYVTEPARQARIAEPLATDREIGAGAFVGNPRVALKYESGGGGLMSTADDYARFLQMMLNGGTLDGKRYLSPKTVEYMTSDHLGSTIPQVSPGYGFGLGFGVRKANGEAPFMAPAGEYNWGGAGGTYFWVDPKTNMFVVLMMQSPKQRVPYRSILRNMVYAAVEK